MNYSTTHPGRQADHQASPTRVHKSGIYMYIYIYIHIPQNGDPCKRAIVASGHDVFLNFFSRMYLFFSRDRKCQNKRGVNSYLMNDRVSVLPRLLTLPPYGILIF